MTEPHAAAFVLFPAPDPTVSISHFTDLPPPGPSLGQPLGQALEVPRKTNCSLGLKEPHWRGHPDRQGGQCCPGHCQAVGCQNSVHNKEMA